MPSYTYNTLHYWTYGNPKDPAILFIHGFRGTHHGLEYIGSKLKNYYIITPDLPGFGASAAFVDKPHTIDSYANLMIDLIHHLELKQPYLLGHSMGSIVVASMLSKRPNITTKTILINPVVEKPSVIKLLPGYIYHRLAGKYLPERLGNAILKNKTLFLLGSSVMTKTKDKKLRKLIHWNHITYMKEFVNRNSLLEAFESSNTETVLTFAETLTVPTLLIAGKQDDIAPIEGQRRAVNTLKNAQLLELDDVGHIVHYEKPIEAAAAIDEFLSR